VGHRSAAGHRAARHPRDYEPGLLVEALTGPQIPRGFEVGVQGT
jgi:hypothetical protein